MRKTKFTKKERLKIYIRLAQTIKANDYCCNMLSDEYRKVFGEFFDYPDLYNVFPEFFFFIMGGDYYGKTFISTKQRTIALLLSAELCK